MRARRRAVVVLTWCAGLVLLSAGIAAALAAGVGVGPLDVASTGLARSFDIEIGWAIAAMNVLLVIVAAVISGRVEAATIATAAALGPTVALWLELIAATVGEPVGAWRWTMLVAGLLLIGAGGAVQISSGWGPSPVDAVTVAIVDVTHWQLRWVRTGLELTFVLLGGLAGGAWGAGTVFLAVGVGPVVAALLGLLRPLRTRLGTTAPGDGPATERHHEA